MERIKALIEDYQKLICKLHLLNDGASETAKLYREAQIQALEAVIFDLKGILFALENEKKPKADNSLVRLYIESDIDTLNKICEILTKEGIFKCGTTSGKH